MFTVLTLFCYRAKMATHTEHTAGGGHGRGGKNTHTDTHVILINQLVTAVTQTVKKQLSNKPTLSFFCLSCKEPF